MSKVFAIALNTFRESIRNKILYSLVLFALLLVGMSAFFGAVSIGSQTKVVKDFGLFSLSFFGMILTVTLGVSLLNKELKQKTVYNILSKPVSRWQFIVGKYLGLCLSVQLLVSLMGLALLVFASFFDGQLDFLLLQALLFTLLEIAVMAAVTLFFSSLVVTTTLTGLFTLGTYIAGRSIRYLGYFLGDSADKNPALHFTLKLLDWLVPDLSLFNVNDLVVYGIAVRLEYLGFALIYAASYALLLLLLASLIFEKRELL